MRPAAKMGQRVAKRGNVSLPIKEMFMKTIKFFFVLSFVLFQAVQKPLLCLMCSVSKSNSTQVYGDVGRKNHNKLEMNCSSDAPVITMQVVF